MNADRGTTDSAARWLARAILTALGIAALWAAFTVRLHGGSRWWPLINSHTTTIGIFVVNFALWAVAVWLVAFALYALVKAASS